MERLTLLVSDVDNTLLGDDAALAQFSNWYETAQQFVRLAYNSGRFPPSLAHSVRTSGLPQPDAYIGGVGTEICLVQGSGSLLHEGDCTEEIAPVKRVPDPLPATDPLGSLERLSDWPPTDGRWDPAQVRAILLSHQELRPQPAHLLSEFKISVYGDDLDEAFVEHLRRQFAARKLDVEVVYSSGRDLDVLPAGTNKGTAVAHLAQHWQIDRQNVIVAGDSGNDLEMFRQGFRGIVVGNALPELKAFTAPHVYHASGHYAAGVLEGLQYWLTDHPAAVTPGTKSG